MPNPGQANNPGGVNGLYESEAPYGTIKRLEQSTKEVATPSAPALNAPRRAQKAAVNRPSQASQAPVQTPADYHELIAQEWARYAAMPGASPLVQEIVSRAARQVNLASR